MIGKNISHYKIIEKLGSGGMGIVYKAIDTNLDRTVALKFLPPELTRDPEAKERFIREAHAASALEHDNICNIHEIDETDDGQLFIVMACYEGQTLKEKLSTPLSPPLARGDKKGVPIEEAIDIATQIGKGLQKAHEKGIIHRDIKPANIFITEDGNVKILDFGLAKLAGQAQLTKDTSTLGTVAYMSPEQLTGNEVDQRTDIWSLGVVMYEMLSCELLFKGEYEQAIIYSILNEKPPPLRQLRPDLPDKIINSVEKCLQKEPQDRYENMEDFRRDISESATYPKRWIKRHWIEDLKRWKYINIAYILIALIVVTAIYFKTFPLLNQVGSSLPSEKHIAILPIHVIGISANREDINALCAGLAENLSSKLTELEKFKGSLWVVPYREIYHRNINTPGEAKDEFGVNLAVTASMQLQDQQIQITVNLVDTEKLRQLSSIVLENQITESLKLQKDVLTELTYMLELELKVSEMDMLSAGITSIESAYDLYIKGRGLLQRYEDVENIHLAIQMFEKALRADPQFALAHAGLGEAYLHKYNFDKNPELIKRALDRCTMALKYDHHLSSTHFTMGLVHRKTGNYSEALKEFNQALVLDPVNDDACRELAGTYNDQNRFDLAESMYMKAIDLQPRYWSNYNKLGVFYFQQARYDEALAQFEKIIELVPNNIKGYNNLGGTYFYLEQNEEAEKWFIQSINIKPNETAYYNLATLNFYEGRFEVAGQFYLEVLKFTENDYDVWGGAAESFYWSENNREKAMPYYQKAILLAKQELAVNPHNQSVLIDLAGYYAKSNEQDSSRAYLDRLLTADPQDMDIMFRIATLFEMWGKREVALAWIKKALLNGFSVAEIATYPGLNELRADKRYKLLLQTIKSKVDE